MSLLGKRAVDRRFSGRSYQPPLPFEGGNPVTKYFSEAEIRGMSMEEYGLYRKRLLAGDLRKGYPAPPETLMEVLGEEWGS